MCASAPCWWKREILKYGYTPCSTCCSCCANFCYYRTFWPQTWARPSCATIALKTEEKGNSSLKSLQLRMYLSNVYQGAWVFEIQVCGGISDICMLYSAHRAGCCQPKIKVFTVFLGWLEFEMPFRSLDFGMLGHALAVPLGCFKQSLVWSIFCARNKLSGMKLLGMEKK